MYAYFIKISKTLKLPNLNIGLQRYIKIKGRKREAFYKRSWEGTSFFIVKMCASVIFQNVTLGNWDAIIYQGTKSFGWKNYFRGTKGEEKSWQILQHFFIQVCQASGSNLYIDILKEPSYLAGKITFVVQKKKKITAKNMCLKFCKKIWFVLMSLKINDKKCAFIKS